MGSWKFHGRRLALAVAALGATGALVGAASFALFTSQATAQTDTFSAGTVILGQTTALPACTFTDGGTSGGSDSSGVTFTSNPMEPGDTGTCTYSLSYTGSLNAWVELGVSATSTSLAAYTPTGSVTQIGGEALLNDGHDANGMAVTITSAGKDGATGGAFSQSGITYGSLTCTNTGTEGANGSAETCNTATPNETLLTDGATTTTTNSAPANSWSMNTTDTITLTGSLPLTAGNGYQGSSATLTLTARAVQASNNALNSSGVPANGFCQTPTSASEVCPPAM